MSTPGGYTLIQHKMDEVEEKILSHLHSESKIVEQMLQYALTAKGKRIRPALVLLSGLATGPLKPSHTEVAVVIELIHTATLVHDDIIDEATLRRQKTSLNVKYGNEMAVIFGDHVLALAFSILADLKDPAVFGRVADVTKTICEGELFQTHRRFDFNLSRTDYLKMIDQKTASLFAVSCRLGAFLAGASVQQQLTLQKFGQEIGMVFQMVDDCLDILGDEDRIGKSLGTDLKKGKWTLPLIRLREMMSGSDWEEVRLLLFEDLEEMRIRRLVSYLSQYGAIDRVVEEAQMRIVKAKSYLGELTDTPALGILHQLADEILERNRKTLQKKTTETLEATSA